MGTHVGEPYETLWPGPEPGTMIDVVRGARFWFRLSDRALHRDDGPAMIDHRGVETWYRRGLEHRSDGPSRTWPGGRNRWMVDGRLHRLDHPSGLTGAPNGAP